MSRKVNPRELDRSLHVRNCNGHVKALFDVMAMLQTELARSMGSGADLHPDFVERIFQQVWEAAYDMGCNVAASEYRKTLRDEFAIAALEGVMANRGMTSQFNCQQLAQGAYNVADCMLATREKGGAT